MNKLYTLALVALISTAGYAMEVVKDDYVGIKIATVQSKIEHYRNKQEIMEKVTGNTDQKYQGKINHYTQKLDFLKCVRANEQKVQDLKEFSRVVIQSSPLTLVYLKEKIKDTPENALVTREKAVHERWYTSLVTEVNGAISKDVAASTNALIKDLGLSIVSQDNQTNKNVTYGKVKITGEDMDYIDRLFDKIDLKK